MSAAKGGTIGVTDHAEPAPNPTGQEAESRSVSGVKSPPAAERRTTDVTDRADPVPEHPAGQVAPAASSIPQKPLCERTGPSPTPPAAANPLTPGAKAADETIAQNGPDGKAGAAEEHGTKPFKL